MSQMNPCQSRVPLQTNPSNFQTCQQTNNQQSTQCSNYPGNSQGQYMQGPFGQFYQQENYPSAQYPCTTQLPNNTTNLCQGIPCQNTMSPMQTQANNNCGSLPQNIIDQIRSCIPNTAPIFIIPGGCQQPLVTTTQQATTIPDILNPLASSNKQSNYIPTPLPPPIYPPTFYPYPIPFPIFDPYGGRSNEQQKNHCGCSSKSSGELTGSRQFPALLPYPHNVYHEEEHRCTNTTDDTICTKRNCPSAISLQALASQLLSVQGIVSCTATRLLLRKIPGSNITTTMEDTMQRAQRSIGALNKDQLLVESRNSQQVNALINLHMTANPPANIIPILTLVQLKVNVLKAQVENLINAKLMENQGLEIEATDSIDPTILAMKTDAELREFLVTLRQKECDERVNLNFAPYRSQRVIAESRLSNVQKKVQQVEAEFERRRCNVAPSIPPMSTRIVREFAETPINFSSHFDYHYPDPTSPNTMTRESPDPFAITPKSPRKLRLKPHVGSPETTYDYSIKKKDPMGTAYNNDKGSQMEPETKGRKRNDRCDHKNCDCYDESSSGESSEEDKKKKLQLRIDERGNVTVSSEAKLNGASFMKLASNVSLRTAKPKSDAFDRRDRKVKPSRNGIEDTGDIRGSSLPRRTVSKVEEEISEVTETDGRITVGTDVDRVPDVKPYGTVGGEKKRESIESAELTSKEFKDEAGAYGDAKGETYVSVSDVNLTDEEKMIKKIVNSSHVKEFTPSYDKEVQIPESKFDKTSVSIDEGVIEVDKIKSDALTEESRMKISTGDSKEKLYDVKGEKIDDRAKSETTGAERMMGVESPKITSLTTASMKIEPTKIDEERTDEQRTAGSSKVADELFDKSKKTFLTSLKIGNSIKPGIKDEKEKTIEVGSTKKTFVSTASMKIEPPKIDEEYIDEPTLRSLKISDVLPEKPKKTFLTTLKIGNSVKPEIKDETKGTIEVGSPKKTFVSTASVRIEPPKIDEGHIDEPTAGTSKVADERSEKPKRTFLSTASIKIEPPKIDEELPVKPKKTFLTTLKIGNSVKPEIKDEAKGTIEVGTPKKTFVSTASIRIEPPKIDVEHIDEPTAGTLKIADERSEKPKKTFLSTASIKIEPPKIDVEHIDEPTAGTLKIADERSEKPKKTFLSTASIKIEPPKIDVEHIDEPTAGTLKIADERSEKPKKTFLSTASIKIEPPKIDEELPDKPKKTFLTTLKIGNSVKPEIKDEAKGTIEVGTPKKTFVSTASIRIEPPNIDEEHNVEPTVGTLKISDELSDKPKKTYLTTLKIGNPIKPEVKDENKKTIETGDLKKTYVTKAFLKIEPENDEERQPKTKMFKSDPMKLRINPNDMEGTNERNPEKSAGTSTIAKISIGKKEGDDDDDDDVIGKKEKSDVGTNEKIVSVLTEIKYDEPEAIAELFRSAFTRNFQLDKDIAERSCKSKYESSDTGNYYTMALSFSENHFPWRIDIKKQENDIERLNNRIRDASENTYHPEETGRKLNTCKYKNDTTRFPFVNSDRDTSDSYVDNDRGILSEIISLMYNQLSYFGGAINKIPLFGNNVRSSFDGSVAEKINSGSSDRRYYSTSRRSREDFEKFWTGPCKEYHAIFEDVRRLDDDEIENHDRVGLYDSIRSIERSNKNVTERVIGTGSSRVIVPRKHDNKEIRDRLRYMIVEDRYNKKCYLMPELVTTFRGHDSRPYARPNLITRPYKIRRHLLIRSRLKDRNAFEQNPLPPFTIVKRTRVGNWKSFCNTTNNGERWRGRRTFSRSRYGNKKGENFYSLPLITEKNSKISSTLEKSSTSKAIPGESDTKTTVTFFSNDSCVSTDATGSAFETRHY